MITVLYTNQYIYISKLLNVLLSNFKRLNKAIYLPCVVTRDDGDRASGDFCPYFILKGDQIHKKDRQHNGQTKKDKRTNNDL
jgi:hypothetical protein